MHAPAVTHQLQQGFWGGAQAGVVVTATIQVVLRPWLIS